MDLPTRPYHLHVDFGFLLISDTTLPVPYTINFLPSSLAQHQRAIPQELDLLAQNHSQKESGRISTKREGSQTTATFVC